MGHILHRAAVTLIAFLGAVFWASSAMACPIPETFAQSDIKTWMWSTTEAIDMPIGAGMHWEDKVCPYFTRGFLKQQMGNYQAAVRDYTSALDLFADFPEALAARGDAYMDMNLPEKADADYAALAPFKENANIQNSICWERLIRGRPLNLAIVACNFAIAAEPNNSHFLQSRCVVNFRLGKYADAVTDCSAAIDHIGDLSRIWDDRTEASAMAYYPRGIAELKMGNTVAGNADIAKAMKDDPVIAERAKTWGVAP
jgi:tetratricopeptide (TPR) repeat protein